MRNKEKTGKLVHDHRAWSFIIIIKVATIIQLKLLTA